MKITGAVRMIKGQEVLPDGSTLDEHGIIDGSTVNIVIEPEKEISIKMKLGPKEFTHKVKSSLGVRDLKQQLIDDDTVGFWRKDFSLLVTPVNKNGFTDNVLLQDESLPLHLCGVSNNVRITIIGGSIKVHLITHHGEDYFKHFPKNITVNQMKQRIHRNSHFFLNPVEVEDVWLFVQRGKSYQKLDDEAPIGEELSNNDIVHIVADRFFEQRDLIPVLYKCEEVDRIGWERRYKVHKYESETVLSVKLRVQEQLGFPVSTVNV